jgi:CRISPR-associated protein Csb2
MSQFDCYACPAFRWLEGLKAPTILAPPGRTATRPYRLYVPNNAADLVAAARVRGNADASIAAHQTEKDVRPTRFASSQPIHYDWLLSPDQYEQSKIHLETLKAAARSIIHLRGGVDLAVGHAELLDTDPPIAPAVERWLPATAGGNTHLRVPVVGTLDALIHRHREFLSRLTDTRFQPVSPLSAFAVVGYRRSTEPPTRPFAAFIILKPDASGFRPFDPVRMPRFPCRGEAPHACGTAVVAGLVRSATARAARQAGWDELRIASFILGHGERDGEKATTDDRLQFLPLPSITPLKVESIRHVLVVGPLRTDIARIRQLLPGAKLIPQNQTDPVAILSLLPQADRNVLPYTRPAAVWSTVSPVVLPGFESPGRLRRKLNTQLTADQKKSVLDRLNQRIDELLRKAFQQAGFSSEIVRLMQVDWRKVGFRPGVDLAGRYDLPPLPYPRYHVRVRFPHPVHGPVAIGAGRYRGLGVFAAETR